MERQIRPSVLQSCTYRVRTHSGNMYVTIGYIQKRTPFEVFVNLGKAGGCESAWIEALSRTISNSLRYGVPAPIFVEQLKGISCLPISDGSTFIHSPADGIALALQDFMAGHTNDDTKAA